MTDAHLWTPRLTAGDGPLYLRIAAAIEDDIAAGRLRPGDRLPSQRVLADTLGIDMTTVTRAYAEGRRRHVLDAVTGRGSFVAAPRNLESAPLDLAMILPPRPRGLALGELMARGLAEVLQRADPDVLMSYHPGAGMETDKAAGAAWLAPLFGDIEPARIRVAAGAQAALAAVLSLVVAPGDTVLCEALAYPGLIAVAGALKLRLEGVPVGPDGIDLPALAAAARRTGARVVCVVPTLQNPTTVTMPAHARAALATLVRTHGLTLIEDDPYAPLLRSPFKAIAALAPEASWHIATLAKCLTPGLRTAYVVAPDADSAGRLTGALRAFTQSAPPLMTALATHWIRSGAAAQLRDGVRAEAEARQTMARAILPAGAMAHPSGLHVWQTLPDGRERAALIAAARAMDVGLMPSDAFAVDPARAPNAVRLSLGAIADRARLKAALETLARLMTARS